MAKLNSTKRHPNYKDLIGMRFGKLVVVKEVLNVGVENGKRTVRWLCQCDCGRECAARGPRLNSGYTRNCGCDRKTTETHGLTKGGRGSKSGKGPPEYQIWIQIHQRCENTQAKFYNDYGGRGIRICKRWREDYAAFIGDLGERPSKKLTVDRENNDGGYTCGKCDECIKNDWVMNCRWATRRQQANNRRNVEKLTWNGKTMTLSEWAEELEMDHHTLRARYYQLNWSAVETLSIPIRSHKRGGV